MLDYKQSNFFFNQFLDPIVNYIIYILELIKIE